MRFHRRALVPVLLTLALTVSCGKPKGSHDDEGDATPPSLDTQSATVASQHSIKTVFVIVMENHDWRSIAGNPSAPYINGTLLEIGAHAEHYTSPENIHPSEPNYIWLEAGDDLDISDDDDPFLNYRTTKNHLSSQMDLAGVSWRSYQEAIPAGICPLFSSGKYGAKHNPFVFFHDVTNGGDPFSAHCIEHVRPYGELEGALLAGQTAAYNFITPDMCNDMHDTTGCASTDAVANGDAWLSREVPKILASKAYLDGGALFITWDESEDGNEPIGLIALSPFAKPGYAGTVPYTHSSLLRTIQDVLGLRPFIRAAASATPLDDLFVSYP